MALEKDVVEGDVLNPRGLGITNDLENPVNHQHRIAVGQDPLDPPDVHLRVPVHQALALGRLLLLQ